MEIHQLKYFAAVAETGSFSRAAERCSVAQPSLSQQIIKLELELGQPLFHRLGRKVILSGAGQLLLPRANAILAELQEIKQYLPDGAKHGQGPLVVGFIPTIAPFVLPQVIRAFHKAFPIATLSVHENLSEVLISDLISGKLDVAIMSQTPRNRMIKTQELLTESLVVASSRRQDPIATTSLRIGELNDYPFIALNEMHCLGEQVRAFCHQQHLDLKITCQSSQLSTLRSCVASGLGISLVPQAFAIREPLDGLAYHSLIDVVPQRKIIAVTLAGKNPSFMTREFIRFVQENYPVQKLQAAAVV